MTRLKLMLTLATAYPGTALILTMTMLAMVWWSVTGTYAVWVQPDPQVLSRPFKYQDPMKPQPVPNSGVDAQGLTLDQWIATGHAPEAYQPVRKTVFKAGESLWTLRFDCFLNKTQDAQVSRAFLGGDGSAGTNRSVYMLPDVQIPTRMDGCAVKNHRTLIPPDLQPGMWTYQVTANFYKSAQQPSVRVLFMPVVIEVTK